MPPTDSTRALPRALVAVLVALLVLRVALALWERSHPPKAFDRVSWLAPAEAIESARLHRRPILYDFSAEWCGPCKRLEAEVFANKDRAAEIATMFTPAKVLDRQQEEGRNPAIVDSLQRHFGIEAFPTLLVVNADGDEVGRVVGFPGAEATRDSLRDFARRSYARRTLGTTIPPGSP